LGEDLLGVNRLGGVGGVSVVFGSNSGSSVFSGSSGFSLSLVELGKEFSFFLSQVLGGDGKSVLVVKVRLSVVDGVSGSDGVSGLNSGVGQMSGGISMSGVVGKSESKIVILEIRGGGSKTGNGKKSDGFLHHF